MPVFNMPFVLSVVGAFLTSSVVAYLYVWPAVRAMQRYDALRLLAAFHAFRFFGMNFLVAGFVSPELSSNFANQVGWGDFVAAVLALLSIAVLSWRWSIAIKLSHQAIYGTVVNTRGLQMRANLKLVHPAPIPVNGTVPKRARNADVRPREYLTPKEVEKLIKAARARGRYGSRDGLAILVAYRHGLRASELAGLRWDQVDFDHGLLHVRRLKNGMDSVHPLSGEEAEIAVSVQAKTTSPC
jgi:hypothetical protein